MLLQVDTNVVILRELLCFVVLGHTKECVNNVYIGVTCHSDKNDMR